MPNRITRGKALIGKVAVPESGLEIGGTAVTSTAAELNALDGLTSTVSELNILDGVTATAAELNALNVIEETVAYGDFTDGGGDTGTYDITAGTIPAGATFLYAAVTSVADGFAGNTSAALTIGDGTDVDRYNTSTIDVFSTAAAGVAAGAPSGILYHDTAKTVKLTIVGDSDFTSVSAGSLTVKLYYLT